MTALEASENPPRPRRKSTTAKLSATNPAAVLGVGGAVDIRKLKPMVFTPDMQNYFGVGNFIGKVFSAGKDV